ncbi:hypothetical protein [Methanoregula sp.]|uniref:hypothetical protein n=1 Tax=Methanoregula sp. TaxID=2052170 RepID=UPI0035697578
MEPADPCFKKTASYRVLIDPDGTSHIRIIRRVNFRTLLLVFKEVYLELKKNPEKKPHIIIYLSKSLSTEMSDNLTNFLDFSGSCVEGTFELRIVE